MMAEIYLLQKKKNQFQLREAIKLLRILILSCSLQIWLGWQFFQRIRVNKTCSDISVLKSHPLLLMKNDVYHLYF